MVFTLIVVILKGLLHDMLLHLNIVKAHKYHIHFQRNLVMDLAKIFHVSCLSSQKQAKNVKSDNLSKSSHSRNTYM